MVEARGAGKQPTTCKTAFATTNYLAPNKNASTLEIPCCRKVKSYFKEATCKFTIERYVRFQKVELGWQYKT